MGSGVDFAGRFSHLIDTVYPTGRGPHTLTEIAEGLAQQGVEISQPYLSLLRNGSRTNPQPKIVTALSAFFNVSPVYFYGASCSEEPDQHRDWLARMQDPKVREIAARSHALSDISRQVIADMVDHLRKVEHISDDNEPDPP